jgi:hypothetical protein
MPCPPHSPWFYPSSNEINNKLAESRIAFQSVVTPIQNPNELFVLDLSVLLVLRRLFSGLLCRVLWWMFTGVSLVFTASLIRVMCAWRWRQKAPLEFR